jgi:putative membrane protein
VTTRGPRFLDEPEDQQAGAGEPAFAPASGQAAPPPAAAGLPRGPVLLDALSDAPVRLDVGWTPEVVTAPRVRVGATSWLAAGLCLLVASWLVLSIVSFVAGLFGQSALLGAAGAVLVGSGVCMVLYAGLLEAGAYRSLGNAERLRAVLAAPDATVATLRAGTLEWLGQVGEAVPNAPTVVRLVRDAGTAVELRGILRSRVADPLRERAEGLGRRAAVEGATLVAICPHPAWDGLVAGARGLLLIRRVAALYGLRPGFVVTLALLRRVAWTAAGTTGLVLVSQGLADHVLTGLPVVKHVAGAIPGTGAVAVRLYRLAGVTAEACCPVPR